MGPGHRGVLSGSSQRGHGRRRAVPGGHRRAERGRRELVATGETVRKPAAQPLDALTAQEVQIARLVRAGQTNPEIGVRLFLSPRTVEWHLRRSSPSSASAPAGNSAKRCPTPHGRPHPCDRPTPVAADGGAPARCCRAPPTGFHNPRSSRRARAVPDDAVITAAPGRVHPLHPPAGTPGPASSDDHAGAGEAQGRSHSARSRPPVRMGAARPRHPGAARGLVAARRAGPGLRAVSPAAGRPERAHCLPHASSA
ncbi:helix-turn-helix transcriptional regulator [Streptomyces sp. NRRL S-1022]|uniref:helix-turn-helix transcriptional regulator n=1 Tax=Streptomyces sp. NRRL S-1022 TaxID=1463880 RepID=UPI003B640986